MEKSYIKSSFLLNIGMFLVSMYTLFSVTDDSGRAGDYAFSAVFPISFVIFMVLSAGNALIYSRNNTKKFLPTFFLQLFPMFYIILFLYLGQIIYVYRFTGILRLSGTFPQ